MLERLPRVLGHQTARLRQSQAFAQRVEAGAVLGHVNGGRTGPDDGRSRRLERTGQLERCLPPELHDDTYRLFVLHDVHHVFKGQRLEVQAVGGVIVGADRLGVAVDHDGFKPGLLKRPDRVNRGVVELDALPDAVRAAAQNHDFLLVGGKYLVFPFVG